MPVYKDNPFNRKVGRVGKKYSWWRKRTGLKPKPTAFCVVKCAGSSGAPKKMIKRKKKKPSPIPKPAMKFGLPRRYIS